MRLLSAKEAAVLLGVESATIRKWVQRGLLSPSAKGRGRGGRHYYAEEDIRAADEATRGKHRPLRIADVADSVRLLTVEITENDADLLQAVIFEALQRPNLRRETVEHLNALACALVVPEAAS